MLFNSATGMPSLHEWLEQDQKANKLFIFGKLCLIHRNSTLKRKLDYQDQWTQYIHPVDFK